MKQIVCMMFGCWLFVSAIAQTTSLCVATDKTTSLVFPFSIVHVDRGTKDILVQPVQEAENILLVKAGLKDFPETNLSVFTADGIQTNPTRISRGLFSWSAFSGRRQR